MLNMLATYIIGCKNLSPCFFLPWTMKKTRVIGFCHLNHYGNWEMNIIRLQIEIYHRFNVNERNKWIRRVHSNGKLKFIKISTHNTNSNNGSNTSSDILRFPHSKKEATFDCIFKQRFAYELKWKNYISLNFR